MNLSLSRSHETFTFPEADNCQECPGRRGQDTQEVDLERRCVGVAAAGPGVSV